MIQVISMDFLSSESDIFNVASSSREGSPALNFTPVFRKSTALSGGDDREVITVSSLVSSERKILSILSNLNEPTVLYGYGRQQPIIAPSQIPQFSAQPP